MQKKIIFCMTSNFAFDQRMQRIAEAFQQYDIVVYNRGCVNYKNIEVLNAACYINKGFLAYIEYNLRLFFHLFFNKYDALYLVDTDTLFAGGMSSFFKTSKFIFDSHEYFIEVPELQDRVMKKNIWKLIEKIFIPRMHLCITVNQSLSEILTREYKKEFFVIRNVPITRTKIEHNSTKKIIIYQGAINVGRGLECAIDAMLHLEGFELHLYGKGDLMNVLKSKVENLCLSAKVFFFGNVNPDVLWQKTNEAYIGLNLLEASSKNYYYSLANKFFDYIHAEVPSVNMAFPEYENILSKHKVGLMLEELNPSLLVNKIKELDNIDFRKQLIGNCIKYKGCYTWEEESKKLNDLVQKVLN